MKLVDMKKPKKTKEQLKKETMPVEVEEDRYPYGLELRFEAEEVEKLPELKNVKIEEKMKVVAEAKVTNIRVSESTGDNKRHSVELQIHKIGVASQSNFDKGWEEEAGKKAS